jgi:Bacterial regulatory proteins, luxR family
VVAAILVGGSEKAAAHRLGLSHSTVKHHLANARTKVGATTTAQLVWILAPRLPEPEAPDSLAEQPIGPSSASTRPGATACTTDSVGPNQAICRWIPQVRKPKRQDRPGEATGEPRAIATPRFPGTRGWTGLTPSRSYRA